MKSSLLRMRITILHWRRHVTDLFTFVVGVYHQLQLPTSDVFQLSPGRLQLSDVITPARFQRRQLRLQLQPT